MQGEECRVKSVGWVGCRAQSAGCESHGAGCRVQGAVIRCARCGVQGAGERAQDAWYRMHGTGCQVLLPRVVGCRVRGAGSTTRGIKHEVQLTQYVSCNTWHITRDI